MIVYPLNAGYRLALPLVCFLALLLSSGCQFTPNTTKMRWPWTKEKPNPQPDRVVAVWTDTVLHQTGQAGVRGFGGRVYFYAQDKTDPIEVDGGLAIYVFDADKLQAHDQRPLRKFVFTAEQFATHMSRTSLGPSYSVWLPWGEVGGPPLRLSLITRYEGTASGTTISEPTIKLLPGVPARSIESEQELAKQRSGSSVQLVGHTAPVDTTEREDQENDNDADNPSVRTLDRTSPRLQRIKTIDLPPSFQRHFQRSGGANQGGDDLPGGEAGDSATPASGSTSSREAPADGPSAALTTVDSKALQALAAAEAEAPVTTQVIDHRTRMQQRFHGSQLSGTSPLDIREGRWIESLPRIGRQ
ncbi:MAG: hypothetical protein IT422_16155 [Pirellulaceae bacterium]|nr:hypothetical protein [Pirellulaceae bacterium]